ncbi:MAG: V-type ATP synthase subunit D [Candidatus Hecatellaceae archaeon]
MSSEVIAGVHATRAELLRLRRRLQLAKRGHDLLVEKRDALLMHFFEAVRELAPLRERLWKRLEEAYIELTKAEMAVGPAKLREVSYTTPDRFNVVEQARSIIGVLVPMFKLKAEEKPETGWYGMAETSAALDRGIQAMEEALKLVVELAEAEAAVKRLAEAVIMTKRRVNALEHIIIPRFENTVRFIQMHLEERAREDFFRLKRIKRIHEAKKAREEEKMEAVVPTVA